MFNAKKAGLSKQQLNELTKLEAEEKIVKELIINFDANKILWVIKDLDDKIAELQSKRQIVIVTRLNRSEEETKTLTVRLKSIQGKMVALHDDNKLLARLRMLTKETKEIERILEVDHGVLTTA